MRTPGTWRSRCGPSVNTGLCWLLLRVLVSALSQCGKQGGRVRPDGRDGCDEVLELPWIDPLATLRQGSPGVWFGIPGWAGVRRAA